MLDSEGQEVDYKSESLGGWDIGLLVSAVNDQGKLINELRFRVSALEADLNSITEVKEVSPMPAWIPANRRRNW